VTARIAGPEIIGIASTVTSIVILISGFLMLDVYLGMKRQLGIAFANNDLNYFKVVLFASILFVTFTLVVTLLILSVPDFRIMELMGIDRDYIWIFMLIIPAYSFNTLFAEAFITMLKSKTLIHPMLIGTMARFPILLVFIYILGYPAIGTILAYFSLFIISTLSYGLELYRNLRPYSFNFRALLAAQFGIISAGLASWVPHIINILGSQLSLITVFTIAGASEAGKFYLPMSIFTLTLFIVSGITRVIHPLLSGMNSEEQKNNLVRYSSKIAFMLTLPLAASFFLFSENFLGILGTDYVSGSLALSILMAGVRAAIITEL
jgi:O-antigen/teichoic acid export membrane protein